MINPGGMNKNALVQILSGMGGGGGLAGLMGGQAGGIAGMVPQQGSGRIGPFVPGNGSRFSDTPPSNMGFQGGPVDGHVAAMQPREWQSLSQPMGYYPSEGGNSGNYYASAVMQNATRGMDPNHRLDMISKMFPMISPLTDAIRMGIDPNYSPGGGGAPQSRFRSTPPGT